MSDCGFAAQAAAAMRPNLVLIMTDNHGPWTLGCYGNRDVRTPHIDRLAKEGIRFTARTVRTPSAGRPR